MVHRDEQIRSDCGGKLRGFLKNTTFNAVAGTTYTVQVKEAGTVVASGDLQPVKRHNHGTHHGRKHSDRHGGKHAFAHGSEKRKS